MNCKKAKRWIPLAAGKDLSAGKAAAVEEHLRACDTCRREAAEIERALRAAKALAGADIVQDWSDAEWRRLIENATAAKVERKNPLAGLSLKPALAGAAALVLLALGSYLVLRKPAATPVTQAALNPPAIAEIVPQEPAVKPEVASKTIVSKQTGLKIIWFYNKNFQGDGYGK